MTGGQAQLSNEPENFLVSGRQSCHHQHDGALGKAVSEIYVVGEKGNGQKSRFS